jgi:hypothetical protein
MVPFMNHSLSGSWGFTIRDDREVLIPAGAANLQRLSDVLHAETLALLYALNISAQMGCTRPSCRSISNAICT